MTNDYAVASRDELWSGGALLESRLTHGRARLLGDAIDADDARDDALIAICERRFDEVRKVMASLGPLRQRGVVEAVREGGRISESSTLTIAFGGVSIVTTPEHATGDAAMLRALLAIAPTVTPDIAPLGAVDPRKHPIVWRNGSAAVLFHEAAGHAAEHAHATIEWPSWLRVIDVGRGGEANLLGGEEPRARRRTSFRDVPLPRMTRLVAEQRGAPFELPDSRIEVHLIAGGSYEPLTEEVVLRVAVADLVEGSGSRRLEPFEFRAGRRELAAAIAGASGEPLRYPGVICSREGQELVVGSFAPVVVTRELG